jgi:hypothetical protein
MLGTLSSPNGLKSSRFKYFRTPVCTGVTTQIPHYAPIARG